MTITQQDDATIFNVSVEHPTGVAATVRSAADHLQLEVRAGSRSILQADLGVDCDGGTLGLGSALLDVSRASITETYTAHVGKSTGERTVDHEEMTVALRSADGRDWQLIVRAAPDGVAFRYSLPQSSNGADLSLGAEHTAFALSPTRRAWLLEYQTWYETERFGVDVARLSDGAYGFPALVEQDEGVWLLLSESDIDGRSSGAHLVREAGAAPGVVRVAAADVPLTVSPAHQTPWRVVVTGTLAGIVASTLVDDLAPAADPTVPVVARPGRGAWSWWSSQYSGAYLADQMRFTDFAAEQGWEHVLVDCGWDAAWVPELVAYASQRGIQVHLWSSWSDLDGPEQLRKLALWKSWGVAGVKVDFMESESQDRYRWYDAIIAEAERVGLMLNFHGSVIPRGWARTHPNVISYEAIRGAEYYVFYGTPLTAAHNVIQPFTRNVVGSMDYTPVAFSAPARTTSDAHELALAVVYESGITHFADDPDEYRSRPFAARFLAAMPPRWHEVRLLGGHPDEYALIARRFDDRWYVGAIATGPSREIRFDPADLVDADYSGWLVTDDDSRAGLTDRTFAVDAGPVVVPVARDGGFVAVLSPDPVETVLEAAPNAVRAAVRIEPVRSLVAREGTTVRVEEGAHLQVPPGWSADPHDDGTWSVLPARDSEPGSVGVLTARRRDGAALPATGHARLFLPLGAGRHDLTTVPYASARNSFGPVETNQTNGGGDPDDGQTMRVAGTEYSTGFGVTDDSAIEFFVCGQGGLFTAIVAIDDETPESSASVVVALDGRPALALTLEAGAPPREVAVDLTGSSVIELRTEPHRTSGTAAHVDWIDPTITIGDHSVPTTADKGQP
ncbi:glycoside hydrolase family 97 catalytic domain-containing protein [Curtobacterium sp. L1-20]|uniref:glycoside hydrolase family 97 catalytic domain-containing protein n=1 Tax=Curtobacterium sp. L1-20 TaxID=3138181 RepID=UPI003B521A2E